MTESEYTRLKYAATDLGSRDGAGATQPCDLSGEWADEPAGPAVVAAIFEHANIERTVDEGQIDALDVEQELLDLYEEAYNSAANIED